MVQSFTRREVEVLTIYAKQHLRETIVSSDLDAYWATFKGQEGIKNGRTHSSIHSKVSHIKTLLGIPTKHRRGWLPKQDALPLAAAVAVPDKPKNCIERETQLMELLGDMGAAVSLLTDQVQIFFSDYRANKELLVQLKDVRAAVERLKL